MAKVRLRYNMDALRLPPEVARGLKALALTPEQARFFRGLTQSPEQARLFRQHLAQSFPDEVDIPPERLVQAVEEATLMSRSEEQDIAGKPPADAPPRGGKKRRRKEPGESPSTTKSKPGSADAWIDHFYPNGEWRLMTAKQIHAAIVNEAKTRGWKKHLSYSAVAAALRRRR
jgi:hypothetical protein